MLSRFSWFGFRIMNFLIRYGKRRFTTFGLFFISALCITAALGLDTNRTTAYEVFTFLLVILLFSFVTSMLDRGRYSISRSLPRYATAGESFTYKVTVRNESSKLKSGHTFTDIFIDPSPSLKEFLSEKAAKDAEGDILSNGLGWPKWNSVVKRKKKAIAREKSLKQIEPNGELTTKVDVIPIRRGSLKIEAAALSRTDIFGLARSRTLIRSEDSTLVLPKRLPVNKISLPGGRKFNPGGENMASSVGDSEEFVGMRDYRAGDPLRSIHWKSLAKTGKPVVKEYQEEFFARYALVVDTFSDKGEDLHFEEAVSVAASLVENIDTKDGLLDLMFVGQKAYSISVGRGTGHSAQLLEVLAVVTSSQERDFWKLREAVVERLALLSGCICVLLSWNDERMRLIGELLAFGIPVKVIVISDCARPDDQDLGPMKSSPHNFHYITVGSIKEGLLNL